MYPDQQWRLEVKLKSYKALREFMDHHELKTAYALAKKAGLKPGAVGHIVSGRRDRCSLKTASAIEKALECPTGFLFDRKMSQVADTMRQSERLSA